MLAAIIEDIRPMPAISHFQASVFAAHRRVANRGNASGDVLLMAYGTNGYNFAAAVTAAIGTLGGIHGPIEATQDFLEKEDPATEVPRMIADGFRVPGWGNHFVRGKPDPDWQRADIALKAASEELYCRVRQTTISLHHYGIQIFPNPSCYTACLSILMGLPSSLAVSLFLEARLPAWRKSVQETYHNKEK